MNNEGIWNKIPIRRRFQIYEQRNSTLQDDTMVVEYGDFGAKFDQGMIGVRTRP
jgi:hypothetical protein